MTLQYDRAGNIVYRSDVGAYVYGDPQHPNAVTSAGSNTYAYDQNGNALQKNGVALTWSAVNLPLVLATATASSTFAYAPDHTRTMQVSSDGTTTIYAGDVEKVITPTETTWRHTVNTPGSTKLVATVTASAPGSIRYNVLLRDHLGSTEAVAQDGQVTSRHRYDVFGALRTAAGDIGALSGATQGRITSGFTGHEMLEAIGLVHMGARVYDPSTARFLSADPAMATTSQSRNGYSYTSNQFLSATDPTGMWDETLGAAINPIIVPTGAAPEFTEDGVQRIVIVGSPMSFAAGRDYIDNGLACLFINPAAANARHELRPGHSNDLSAAERFLAKVSAQENFWGMLPSRIRGSASFASIARRFRPKLEPWRSKQAMIASDAPRMQEPGPPVLYRGIPRYLKEVDADDVADGLFAMPSKQSVNRYQAAVNGIAVAPPHFNSDIKGENTYKSYWTTELHEAIGYAGRGGVVLKIDPRGIESAFSPTPYWQGSADGEVRAFATLFANEVIHVPGTKAGYNAMWQAAWDKVRDRY